MTCRFPIAIMACAGLLPLFARCEVVTASMGRDPFWPVGYQPPAPKEDLPPPPPVKVVAVKPAPAPAPSKPAADWTLARRMLNVSGFAEGNDVRSCFINGRLVSEGETVTLVHAGYRYTWLVARVSRDPADQQFEELTVKTVTKTP